MLYLVTGASGSGKTACLDVLRQRKPQVVWYDFDDVGVPADAASGGGNGRLNIG